MFERADRSIQPSTTWGEIGEKPKALCGKMGEVGGQWWWWWGVPKRERKHERAKRKTENRKNSQETFNIRNASHCCNISPFQFPQPFRKVLHN